MINRTKADIESCVYIGSNLNVEDYLDTKELVLNLTHFGLIGFTLTTMHINKYDFQLFVINPDKYEQGVRCHKIAHAKFAMICVDNGDNKSYLESLVYLQEIWNCNKLGAVPVVFILGNITTDNYESGLHEKFIKYIDDIRVDKKLPVHVLDISNGKSTVLEMIDKLLSSYTIGDGNYRNLPQFKY